MPRPARVKFETIFEVLKKLQLFDENGQLKKQKDPVWKDANKMLKEQISTHSLYIFVHQDRHNVRTLLMKHFNINTPIPKRKRFKQEEPMTRFNNKWNDYEYYDQLDAEVEADEQEQLVGNLDALIAMKKKSDFKDKIHKLAVIPFTVIYWHPEQITLWTEMSPHESTIGLIVLSNIISRVSDSIESGNVNLYALTVKVNNSIILLGQMMSDSFETLEIENFLSFWIKRNAPAPQEIVLGYSYYLLDAASLAFNFCSFDQYNLRCFEYLVNESSTIPSTQIQIDIITLIKVVNEWPCFENISQQVKDFYLCSIMYLSTIGTLSEFIEAVVSILILCQSPYQNEMTESRKANLWVHLTSDLIQNMNQDYIQYMTSKTGPKSFSFLDLKQYRVLNSSPHAIYDYIAQLKLEAFEMCDFSMDTEKVSNDYYCPIVLENFIQILTEFPSWTKLICKQGDNASLVAFSASKHLLTLTSTNKPKRPPQFLEYHLAKITVMSQLSKKYTKGIAKSENPPKSYTNNHAHLTQSYDDQDVEPDDRIEISIPPEESWDTPDNVGLDFEFLKNSIMATLGSISDFDKYVTNTLEHLQSGQEMALCRTLLDCCTEIKNYEKFLGIIVEKFCTGNEVIESSFREIFGECYRSLEMLDKNELKNISKLFSHILVTDCISWEVFSVVNMNEKDLTAAKKNFLRILLREMAEQIGVPSLQERFKDSKLKLAYTGLFPTIPKDSRFAASFYKSIGLKSLADIIKERRQKDSSKVKNEEKVKEKDSNLAKDLEQPSTSLKRSASNSSLSSTSSCDFVIELRVSKKPGKDNLNSSKKKVLKIKS